MQVIRTRYLPRTETKPQRIIAECDTKKITLSWDSYKSQPENHAAACKYLMRVMDWLDEYETRAGEFKGDYYHVMVRR